MDMDMDMILQCTFYYASKIPLTRKRDFRQLCKKLKVQIGEILLKINRIGVSYAATVVLADTKCEKIFPFNLLKIKNSPFTLHST